MLIISAGMPKSGSAYFYNVINELALNSKGFTDARQIKNNRNLDQVLMWHNNNVGALSFKKLLKLCLISIVDGSFVVKTHNSPNRSVRILSMLGLIKIVYSYRDPRDVLLSATDHGEKIMKDGESHTFAKMVNFDDALSNVKSWINIWELYTNMPSALCIKYEDMMDNPLEAVKSIKKHLDLSVSEEKTQEIIWKYSKDNPEGDRTGMHFNKPKNFRYLSEMTQEEQMKCRSEFGAALVKMEYDL